MELVNPLDSKILAIYTMLTFNIESRKMSKHKENCSLSLGILKRKAYYSHFLKDYHTVASELIVQDNWQWI